MTDPFMPLLRRGFDPVPDLARATRRAAGRQAGVPVRHQRLAADQARRRQAGARRRLRVQQRLRPDERGGRRTGADRRPGRSRVRRPARPHPAPQAAHSRVHRPPAEPAEAADHRDRQRTARRGGGGRSAGRPGRAVRDADPVAGHVRTARRAVRGPRRLPDAVGVEVRHLRQPGQPDGRDHRIAGLPEGPRAAEAGEPGRRTARRHHHVAGRRHHRRRTRRARRRPAHRRPRDHGQHAVARCADAHPAAGSRRNAAGRRADRGDRGRPAAVHDGRPGRVPAVRQARTPRSAASTSPRAR